MVPGVIVSEGYCLWGNCPGEFAGGVVWGHLFGGNCPRLKPTYVYKVSPRSMIQVVLRSSHHLDHTSWRNFIHVSWLLPIFLELVSID